MSGSGTAVLDFGAAPGATVALATITGQAGIIAGSHVECYVQGNDSTAEHNAEEHALMDIIVRCVSITAATGFTAKGTSSLRLTGTVSFRWVWS